MSQFQPPDDWWSIETLDAHAAGEPLRIVTSGLEPIPGATILAKRAYAQRHLDHVRRRLMWEPRGHADMYGAILTEPERDDGDCGVLFMHNEGFSTMCGHGIIALASCGVAAGLFGPEPPHELRLDTPAGRIVATPRFDDGRISGASFINVPSFVLHRDLVLGVAGKGEVRCDVAYGGAFYAYVDAADVGLDLRPANVEEIIDVGRRITSAVARAVRIEHPEGSPDLGFLYGTIFVGPAERPEAHSRNVCVFAEGEVDRSPTGTGVSGRLAIHHARGDVKEDRPVIVESLIGTSFTGRIVGETTVGGLPAVVPEITGSAWLTGHSTFYVDPADPLGDGFFLR